MNFSRDDFQEEAISKSWHCLTHIKTSNHNHIKTSPTKPVWYFLLELGFCANVGGKMLNTAFVCITCNSREGANIIKHSDNTLAIERILIPEWNITNH